MDKTKFEQSESKIHSITNAAREKLSKKHKKAAALFGTGTVYMSHNPDTSVIKFSWESSKKGKK